MTLAARIGDIHICPMVTPGTPPVPHVGGPITMGEPSVLIGFMPAARVGDMCTCVGPPDAIAKGSLSVLVGMMPAARMGDPTVHGGAISAGCPTVLIGDIGAGGAAGGIPASSGGGSSSSKGGGNAVAIDGGSNDGGANAGGPTDGQCMSCAKNSGMPFIKPKNRMK